MDSKEVRYWTVTEDTKPDSKLLAAYIYTDTCGESQELGENKGSKVTGILLLDKPLTEEGMYKLLRECPYLLIRDDYAVGVKIGCPAIHLDVNLKFPTKDWVFRQIGGLLFALQNNPEFSSAKGYILVENQFSIHGTRALVVADSKIVSNHEISAKLPEFEQIRKGFYENLQAVLSRISDEDLYGAPAADTPNL